MVIIIDTLIPKKITRVILNLKNLVVKLHVKVFDDTGGIHNEFGYNGSKYLKLDNVTFISLDMIDGNTWSKDKSIIITQNNIYAVVTNMKKIINDIYNENIFANKSDGEIIAYKDMVEKFTRRFTLTGTNQQILLRPGVVYDENEVSYEGIQIYFNKFENKIDLTIDVFESLCYTLEQIDLFTYSQLLVNYYVSYYNKKYNELFNETKQIVQAKPKVQFTKPQEDTTESNFRKNTDKEVLFSGLDTNET